MSRKRGPVTRREFRRWKAAEERRWNRRVADILNAVAKQVGEPGETIRFIIPGDAVDPQIIRDYVARQLRERSDA